VKRPPRPTHSYLTETERQQLDILMRRGARGLAPAECNRLIALAQHHFADLQHARAVAGGLRREVNSLRQRVEAAEAALARQEAAR